jgi:hypothetical protein
MADSVCLALYWHDQHQIAPIMIGQILKTFNAVLSRLKQRVEAGG